MIKNEHTGDDLKSKVVNDLYREGFDRIFGQTGLEESSPSILEDAEDASQQKHD